MKTDLGIQSTVDGQNARTLYNLAILAAILMSVIILVQFVVIMTVPPPYEGTALDWFQLFQRDRIAGLIDFELSMVVYTVVSLAIAIALYTVLKHVDRPMMQLYLALSLVGVVAFTASRPALEMLALSDGYAAATTEAQQSIFLAAGQAKLATFHGTAFQVSYILGSLSGLILSSVLWKSKIFSKKIASLRIASSVCDFGLYVPAIGMYISMFSVLFLFAWNILIARRLYQLGRVEAQENSKRTTGHPFTQELESL